MAIQVCTVIEAFAAGANVGLGRWLTWASVWHRRQDIKTGSLIIAIRDEGQTIVLNITVIHLASLQQWIGIHDR